MTKPTALLNPKEMEFIAETFMKELFFSSFSDSLTDIENLSIELVEWEREKLLDESIGSDSYERDIEIADSILHKLKQKEDASASSDALKSEGIDLI